MSTASKSGIHPTVIMRSVMATLMVLAASNAIAAAVEVTLCAEPFTQSLPGASDVPMWGYRKVDTVQACGSNAGAGTASPGPRIALGPDDGPLRITLVNKLNVPTSIVIAGQSLPSNGTPAPVHAIDVVGPSCNPAAGTVEERLSCRVRSFAGETPPGESSTYTFVGLKPGTYLYQSGTHPQVQIQMGLFGLTTQDASASGVSGRLLFANAAAGFDVDVPVVLSEIDLVQHNRIASTLGSANPASWKAGKNTTLNYSPRYFLINGRVFDAASPTDTDLPVSAPSGSRIILRLANAGLRSSVLMLNNGTWKLLTEDGNPYPAAREQATVLLPASKTSDALLISNAPVDGSTSRSMVIFDRRGGTDNADGNALGGQVARLAVSGPVGPFINPIGLQVANEGSSFALQLQGSNITGYSLTNAPSGMTIGAGGLISWPAVPSNTAVPTTYAVTVNGVGTLNGAATTVTRPLDLRINHAPTIMATGPIAVSHNTVSVAAPGVLAGASDPDGDLPLAAVQTTAPSSGTLTLNPDGSYTWSGTVPNTVANSVTFGVASRDPYGLVSAPRSVTLNVAANVPPIAANDSYTITLARIGGANGLILFVQAPDQVAALTKPINPTLTGNDSDPDGGSINQSSVSVIAGSIRRVNPTTGATIALPTSGLGAQREATVTIAADGTFRFTPRIPNTNIAILQTPVAGTYEFRYTVRDDQGSLSNQGVVRVTVQ